MIKAEARATWDELEAGGAGGFMFDAGQRSLIFLCPCGCGRLGALPVYRADNSEPVQRPAWLWDGNTEAPTLQPSIQRADPDGCRWHGFLTAGEWRTC